MLNMLGIMCANNENKVMNEDKLFQPRKIAQ